MRCHWRAVFLEITFKGIHATQTAGLADLNRQLERYYRIAGRDLTKVSPLSLSQIISRSLKYPFLKTKAAPARQLAEFCLNLAYKHYLGDDTRPRFAFPRRHHMHSKVNEHLKYLVEMFQGMDKYVRSLHSDPFEPAMCQDGMLQFLQSLQRLNALWRAGRAPDACAALPFVIRPKCHVLMHLILDCAPVLGNPSQYWCYRDEDFVGNIKRLCARTRHPATLESRVLLKLRILEGLSIFL